MIRDPQEAESISMVATLGVIVAAVLIVALLALGIVLVQGGV